MALSTANYSLRGARRLYRRITERPYRFGHVSSKANFLIQASVFNKRSRYLVKATLIHHHVLFIEAWVDYFAYRSVVTSMLELNVDPVVEKVLSV
jgi:hypothetical protein